MTALDSAVTWLFVPGDRPDRFAKATAAGADVVIADLQDAVAPAAKAVARQHVCRWLSEGARVCVRINPPSSEAGQADIAALAELAAPPAAVMVPLAEAEHEVGAVYLRLGVPSVALVETARGVEAIGDIARAPGVARIALGHLDLAADLGCDPGWTAMAYPRSRVVLASRAARLPAPVDGVTTDISDPEATGNDARMGRQLGFGGKLCIHPGQIRIVADAYRPTEAEIAWALRVRAAMDGAPGGSGAVSVDGAMVDAPVLRRAQAVLAKADRTVA